MVLDVPARAPVHPLTAISGIVVLLPLTYLAYCIVTLPGEAVIEPTASALVVQADGGQVFATRGVFKGEKLSAQELPRNLKDAIIAIEDRHFFAHGGFYLPSLFRAAFRNAMAGATREGGSTITQQLARMTDGARQRAALVLDAMVETGAVSAVDAESCAPASRDLTSTARIGALGREPWAANELQVFITPDESIRAVYDTEQAAESSEPRIAQPCWSRCPACQFDWREWVRSSIIFVSLSFITDTCPNCRKRHVPACATVLRLR
jgi:hypothetical protein